MAFGVRNTVLSGFGRAALLARFNPKGWCGCVEWADSLMDRFCAFDASVILARIGLGSIQGPGMVDHRKQKVEVLKQRAHRVHSWS